MKTGGNQVSFYYKTVRAETNISKEHVHGGAFISGNAEGGFRPDDPILRGETLEMLYDYLNLDFQGLLNTGLHFDDISKDDRLYSMAIIMAMREMCLKTIGHIKAFLPRLLPIPINKKV